MSKLKNNPLGLVGIDFVEFCSDDSNYLHDLFLEFGFSLCAKHCEKEIYYYNQNDIHFFLNKEKDQFAGKFRNLHGPSICSMGWRMENSKYAQDEAIKRGAKKGNGDFDQLKAIYGIGESLIYFVDNYQDEFRYEKMGFEPISDNNKMSNTGKGFIAIDHLTNNVGVGQMEKWANFYKDIFGFSEVRYFDIRGAKTGLISYALQAPNRSFCIPINEATDKKSQIQEYLEEYNGPGVQHLAFISHDIVKSLHALKSTKIETLSIDDEYYDEVFDRVPGVTEDPKILKDLQILVDGDKVGYLLQIFTKNIIGPIFIEIIQRKNHFSFGEGNFGALFRSIEKDQQKRGYLD